jgi:hypothetical protein
MDMDSEIRQDMNADDWKLDDRALSFWYRPWLYVHPTWLQAEGSAWLAEAASEELMQRIRYPAWCEAFSLPRHPVDYDGSIWWTIASVTHDVFERASYLAGLVLVFARNRRDSFALTSSAGMNAARGGDLRWVLQNACFVPQAVLELEGWEGVTDPDLSGFLALNFAVAHAAPCLASRIALRYRREHAQRERPEAIQAASAEDAARAVRYMARLWQSTVARCAAGSPEDDYIGARFFAGVPVEGHHGIG